MQKANEDIWLLGRLRGEEADFFCFVVGLRAGAATALRLTFWVPRGAEAEVCVGIIDLPPPLKLLVNERRLPERGKEQDGYRSGIIDRPTQHKALLADPAGNIVAVVLHDQHNGGTAGQHHRQAAVNAAAGDQIGNAFPFSRKAALPALQYSSEYLAGGSVVNGRSKNTIVKLNSR